MNRAGEVALGLLVDRLLGEPPERVHPLLQFGRAVQLVERATYRDGIAPGLLLCALGTGAGVATGALVRSVSTASWLSVGANALEGVAREIGASLEAGDLPRARELLPAMVGRNPAGLDENEIARAVVESVAENTVDAVVAPAAWAVLCGAPGALAYRAVNTLDAMVGHPSERYLRYGRASARLDDLAGWFPARLTAALVALVRPRTAADVLRVVQHQAPAHPSPNAGVSEGAFAAALGLRLGGENRYGERVERRPALGRGRAPEPPDIERAVRLSRDVTTALIVGLGAAGTVATALRRRQDRRAREAR